MIVVHHKDNQDSDTRIVAYCTTLNFLKDYIAKFGRLDVEFVSLFKTEKLLVPIDTKFREGRIL